MVRWLDPAPFADSLCARKVKAELSVPLSQVQGVPEQARAPHVLPDLCARPDSHHHLPRQVRVHGGAAWHAGWRCRNLGGWTPGQMHVPDASSHADSPCSSNLVNRKNRPRDGGICVANHTSPIDVIILASDGYYAMVRPPSESPLAGHGRELCLQGVSGQACFQTRAPAWAVTLVSVASGAPWDLGAVSRVAEHVGKVEVGSGKAGGGGEGGFLSSPRLYTLYFMLGCS